MQNNTWSQKDVLVCSTLYTIMLTSLGLEQHQDIQGAVQNRDRWVETSHIDSTTYFQLSEMERLR